MIVVRFGSGYRAGDVAVPAAVGGVIDGAGAVVTVVVVPRGKRYGAVGVVVVGGEWNRAGLVAVRAVVRVAHCDVAVARADADANIDRAVRLVRQLHPVGSRAILVHGYGVRVEGEAAGVVVVLARGNGFGEGFACVCGGMGDGAPSVRDVDVIGGAQRYRLRGVVVLRRECESGGRDGDVLVGVVAGGGCGDADGNIRRGLGVDAHVVGRGCCFRHGDVGHIGIVLLCIDAHLRVDFVNGNRRGNIVEPSAAGGMLDGRRAVDCVLVVVGADGNVLLGVPVRRGKGQLLGACNLDVAGRWVLALRYVHGNIAGGLVA